MYFYYAPWLTIISLLVAFLLDTYCGEPKKYHPLVALGWLIQKTEALLWCERHALARGAVAVMILLLITTLLFYGLLKVTYLNLILPSVILYLCIARKSLIEHAQAVVVVLGEKDMTAARTKVGYMVS